MGFPRLTQTEQGDTPPWRTGPQSEQSLSRSVVKGGVAATRLGFLASAALADCVWRQTWNRGARPPLVVLMREGNLIILGKG